LQLRCAIDQNFAQFVKYCASDKLISGAARLVKRAIDQMRATAIPPEAVYSRKIKFLSKL